MRYSEDKCANSLPTGKDAHKPPNHNLTEVSMFKRLFREESGQDMVEYALLASFISIVAIATLRLIGPLVNAIYVDIQAALT